jgi:hypothetical protein
MQLQWVTNICRRMHALVQKRKQTHAHTQTPADTNAHTHAQAHMSFNFLFFHLCRDLPACILLCLQDGYGSLYRV